MDGVDAHHQEQAVEHRHRDELQERQRQQACGDQRMNDEAGYTRLAHVDDMYTAFGGQAMKVVQRADRGRD